MLDQRQPWGSLRASFEFSQYLHDPSFYRIEGGGFISYRITRGLSINMNGSASRIRDQLNLPLRDVMMAIQRSNNDVGGSVIEMSENEYMVRSRGYLKGVEDIKQIPVGMPGGRGGGSAPMGADGGASAAAARGTPADLRPPLAGKKRVLRRRRSASKRPPAAAGIR